jgi:hypothetical protein
MHAQPEANTVYDDLAVGETSVMRIFVKRNDTVKGIV